MGECSDCGVEGYEGPTLLPGEDPFDKLDAQMNNEEGDTILWEMGGEYHCFICHCKIVGMCYQCWEMTNRLIVDIRCKNAPHVCGICIEKPTVNHMWMCYGDGCMTPGEVAYEEWNMMKEEGEV